MALNTYTLLIAAIQAWVEDDDAEFAGSLPDIVNLGELRVIRDLDLSIFRRIDSTATVTISNGAVTKPTIASPDLLVAAKDIWLTGGALTGGHMLANRSMEFVVDYNAGGVDGVPDYFSEQDESTWLIGRTPDAAYVVNVRYLSRPEPLSGANDTNWISDTVSDFLFKACLAEAEGFLLSDERKPVWETDYMATLPKVRSELYPMFGTQYDKLGLNGVALAPRSTPT